MGHWSILRWGTTLFEKLLNTLKNLVLFALHYLIILLYVYSVLLIEVAVTEAAIFFAIKC